jgi:hypothetical protein
VEHVLPHPHPSPSGSGRHPWRTIAVVAAGIATLELVGLVLVGVALVAKPVMHRARAEAKTSTPTAKPVAKTPTRPLLPRARVSVTILNGNGVSGAAAAEASRVRARGYVLGQVGNAPRGGYGQSIVMYRPGRRGEALRLGRELQIRLVSPLDGLRPRDLHGAKLAVVVGG